MEEAEVGVVEEEMAVAAVVVVDARREHER
jgi:hypothetical protein